MTDNNQAALSSKGGLPLGDDEHYLKRELYELVASDPEIFDFIQAACLDGVWYWDIDKPEHEWMSPAFWELLGYDPETMQHLASEWQGIINPDDFKVAIDNFQKHCADPNHPYDQVVRYRHADGSTVWVRCRGLAIRDATGRAVRMLGAHTNISEQKRNEFAALQLTAIIDSSVDAIYRKSPQGVIETWNRGAELIYGYSANEIIGQNVSILVEQERQNELSELLAKVMRGDSVQNVDTVRLRKDGSKVHVALSLSPIRDAFGTIIGDSTSARDIGERRALEQQLIIAGRMASVGTLAAGVAHEINNPLTYVSANLESAILEVRDIAGGSASGRLRDLAELLKDARDGADRISRIVRGLKVLSRSDAEPHALLELGPVLETSVNLSFNEIRHCAQLIKEFGPTPLVSGDEGHLVQVFVNLLVNAAHAIPVGMANQNEIRLVTRTDGEGRAVIEVHDTGAGIPEAIRDRIFDPFFTTKPVDVGTGLGLPISLSMIKAHNGNLSFETETGKGTTFRVTLPGAVFDQPVRIPSSRQAVPRGRRGKVLIIDDEPLIAKALTRVVASDHDAVVCSNGRDALDRILAGERFDVILCDLMMPVMTGMDLYKELSRCAPDQLDKMIFVTGGASTPACQAFLESTPNTRLEKPFDFAALRALVQSRVGHPPAD